jgi:tetratricopeptide (TPR) repeat protein
MRPLAVFVTAAWSLLAFVAGVLAQDAPRQSTEANSNFFDPESGKGVKCYVVTRDEIQYGERAGFDPKSGRACRPLTPEVVERLRAYKWGTRPGKIEIADPVFFSLRTGEPIVWYHRQESGIVELFDLMGFHPDTGDELLPVTKEIVALWRSQEKTRKEEERRRKQEEARQAPQLIDPDKYAPFDPISGEPRVWYSQNGTGEYQFYDNPGYDPRTGEPLAVVTRDIIDAWHNSLQKRASQKCYIITLDAREPVQYRERAGTDIETGRQCRMVTPEILERLREYEKGKRPTRIESGDPTFFDPRTGEPIVWHVRNQRGDIELFDLMGFHPNSGEELVPVTREVASLWKEQSRRQPPKRIDPEKRELFDPLTGEPRTWYWRNDKGEYEFYDNPGYHPRTGEPLTSLTKEEAAKRQKEAEEAAKRQKEAEEAAKRQKQAEEAAKRQKEAEEAAKRQKEAEEAAKRQKEAEEAAKRQKQAEEAAKRQREEEARKRKEQEQTAKVCDKLAANPTDQNRAAQGVTFEVLKGQAREAIENCELAAKQSPTVLRFKYQWARALQTIDREKSLEMMTELVKKRYPSAFDNAGWLLITQREKFAEAVNHFRRGVELGDPDAMVSLAEMCTRGYAKPRQGETPIALLERAARLGHIGATRELERLKQESVELENQRAFQEEQSRRGLELFRNMLPGLPRR